MTKLISLHRESAIAGAAILSNLALTPSLPVAFYTEIERRRLTTLFLDICGILSVPETSWDRGDGGGGLAPVDELLLSPISEVRFFWWQTKKQFKVSAISALLVTISLSSANCCNSCSGPFLPDRHLIRFHSFLELCLFSVNLVLKYVSLVCPINLVTSRGRKRFSWL